MNLAQWTPQQRELWARLADFDLDEPGASLDFSRRLARENGWTHSFARRVVEEYKRFLFLAMSAGHPVTPSDEVDQAWHLHLVYTRSYWGELCPDVLRAPLHHGPTRGGAREGAKFGQWYAQTRASYARFFGESAPPDIWPDAEVRFGHAPHFRRVNARRHWIVGKPRLPTPEQVASMRIAPAFLVALVLLSAGGVAVGAQVGFNPWNWGGAAFLTLFWSLIIVGAGVIFWAQHAYALPTDSLPPDVQLDVYALTRLQGENEMPIDAAVANMIAQGQIAIDADRQITQTGQAPAAPWERLIWDKLSNGPRDLRLLRGELMPKLTQFDAELERMGLLIAPATRAQMQTITLAICGGLLALGGSKILVGLSRERPVGYLTISCLIVLILSGVALFTSPRRSRRGDALLETLRQKHGRGSLSLPAQTGESLLSGAPLAGGLVLGMALWGYSEMDAFGLSEQRLWMRPPATSGGDSGGGGDGGGGCGGGGCGGCGGCGG